MQYFLPRFQLARPLNSGELKKFFTSRHSATCYLKVKRGPMKTNLKALSALALLSLLPYGIAQTSSSGSKSTTKKKQTASEAAVQAQIDALRNEMQSQIQSLKQQLSEKDAQLQQAQQAAAAAQSAAQQAQQAAQQAQQANSTNTEAVTSLQGAVTDLKTNNASLAQTVQDAQKQTKALENPDVIHFKGVTLSPTGSYLAAETVWRSAATAGGIATPFSSLPIQAADAAHLSEFFATAQQSRIALLAEGKTPNFTLRGYYEADFLSSGNSSNSNQSNSYTLRQRQLWGQASTAKWTVSGGQMWSLATEYKPDSQLGPGKEQVPQTIDPNYNTGFTWERQYGFRASMNLPGKTTLAFSVENPEVLNLGGTVPTFLLVGGPGSTNLDPTANYSYNLAPDLIVKASADPSFGGHYEAYGIGRFFHWRTYTSLTAPVNAYNDSTVGGGVGGSARYSVFEKKVDFGIKGLWGDGISRYGDSTLADATATYAGTVKLLHGYSAMGTIEAHATPRLDLYLYYGTDGVFRNYSFVPAGGYLGLKAGTPYGYGNYFFNNAGCFTEPLPGGGDLPTTPSNCAANTRDVQEITFGYWYDFYKGPMGRLRQGFQYSYATRNVFSGIGATPQATDSMFWTSFRYYLP